MGCEPRGKPDEEVQHVLVDEGGFVEERGELLQLRRGGKLAVEQEVGHLGEGGLLRQLLDGIAAVAQDPLLPVDEGDGAPAGAGVLVALVQRDVARRLAQARRCRRPSPPRCRARREARTPCPRGSSARSRASLPLRCFPFAP